MRREEVQEEQAARATSLLIPPDRRGARKTEADAERLLLVCCRGASETTPSAPLPPSLPSRVGEIRRRFNKPSSGAQVEFATPSRCAKHPKMTQLVCLRISAALNAEFFIG